MRYPVASGLPTGKSKPSASLVTPSFGSASAAAAMKPRATRKNDFLRMEDGSKRDQDTWQAFPDKTGKIFALFYKIETGCGVWRLEFGVPGSEFGVPASGVRWALRMA